jgi:hypothetical protein
MLSATCHRGAVRIEILRRPRTLTNSNCSEAIGAVRIRRLDGAATLAPPARRRTGATLRCP